MILGVCLEREMWKDLRNSHCSSKRLTWNHKDNMYEIFIYILRTFWVHLFMCMALRQATHTGSLHIASDCYWPGYDRMLKIHVFTGPRKLSTQSNYITPYVSSIFWGSGETADYNSVMSANQRNSMSKENFWRKCTSCSCYPWTGSKFEESWRNSYY